MKAYFTLFRKNLTRFWPVVAGVGLVMYLLALLYGKQTVFSAFGVSVGLSRCFLVIIALYGHITALCLFGDLLSGKHSGMLFSMPFSRAGFFLVQFLTGILFGVAILPGLLQVLRIFDFCWKYIYLYLLFYGVSTFGVMLSGNFIGAVLLSGSILAIPVALRWFLSAFYYPYLPGVGVDNTPLFDTNVGFYAGNNILIGSSDCFLGILGLVFAAAAFVLFLLRKAESVGQFSTVSFIRYIFCGAASVIASALLFTLLDQDADRHYWALFLYIPVFYFVFAMVTEKRFLVFQKGHLLTLSVLAAVLFNSFWIIRSDALGIVTYVPDPEKVKMVEVSLDANGGSYHVSNFNRQGLTVHGLSDITAITETHSLYLLPKAAFESGDLMVYLTYTLKSGVKVRRYYPMEREQTAYKNINNATSTKESVFGLEDWSAFKDSVYRIEFRRPAPSKLVYYFTDDPEEAVDPADITIKIIGENRRKEVLDNLLKDVRKGYMPQLDSCWRELEYTVTLYYRDARGRSRTKTFRYPAFGGHTSYFLNTCWKASTKLTEKIITDDVELLPLSSE